MVRTTAIAVFTILVGLVLALGCAPAAPAGDGGGGDQTGGTGDAATGMSIYDNDCARCHRLGGYDLIGTAPNLAGREGDITAAFLLQHRNLTLSDAELAGLQAFVAAQ